MPKNKASGSHLIASPDEKQMPVAIQPSLLVVNQAAVVGLNLKASEPAPDGLQGNACPVSQSGNIWAVHLDLTGTHLDTSWIPVGSDTGQALGAISISTEYGPKACL